MTTKILSAGKPILNLAPPIRKVALWHVTKRCNMECKYCYGTFNGSSYKNNIRGDDFQISIMLKVVKFLSESRINRIHLCGGEPFLYKDFYKLLEEVNKYGMESYVLSNLTFLPEYVEKLFKYDLISSLSFSLDSLNKDYNLYIRGAHDIVINNVKKIIDLKQKYNSNIELGLYVVVTKKNLIYLKSLIDWAIESGINYITLQAVYLPKTHKFYDELSLTNENLINLQNSFNYLLTMKNKIRVSGNLLRFITSELLSKDNLCVENCFVETNSQYYFIDGNGNIKTCTTKEKKIGCICDLPDIKNKNKSEKICNDFCLDCIGIWEMVYPEEVNNIIQIFG